MRGGVGPVDGLLRGKRAGGTATPHMPQVSFLPLTHSRPPTYLCPVDDLFHDGIQFHLRCYPGNVLRTSKSNQIVYP